ncbi:hypothetical protein KIN20_016146 [Parelaphostrongylus tenuis]|uniref:Uncharacterized protein n=1 Tax=Parelaphostrongylus tenuis TaxID=148309 RepID=A0AAD5N4Y2_PARTN|nr:hypothetical protein KIN20_016146 [Parelaphostrongylus tenuis]
MKRVSENAETALVSPKCIKLNREELESADTATLIEKLVSLTDQLNEGNQMVRMWKTRLALARLQVLQINKELKDIFGGQVRDDIIGSNSFGICPIHTEFPNEKKFKVNHVEVPESEKNIRKIAYIENKLALAHSALCAIRKEKKEYAQEISERDAKIAELEKELYQYRRYVIEQDASEHTELDLKEDPKSNVASEKQELKPEEKEQLAADTVEGGCDVVVLDDVSA